MEVIEIAEGVATLKLTFGDMKQLSDLMLLAEYAEREGLASSPTAHLMHRDDLESAAGTWGAFLRVSMMTIDLREAYTVWHYGHAQTDANANHKHAEKTLDAAEEAYPDAAAEYWERKARRDARNAERARRPTDQQSGEAKDAPDPTIGEGGGDVAL